LWLLVLVAACDRGGSSPEPIRGPKATGSIVFDARPASEADLVMRTEAAIVASRTIVDRVREQFRTELATDSIRVARRPGTMILDITVLDADPNRAAEKCNQLLQTYVDGRKMRAIYPLREEAQAVAALLERSPDDKALLLKQADIEVKLYTHAIDVHVLERCRS
jgi:hypothetical protein